MRYWEVFGNDLRIQEAAVMRIAGSGRSLLSRLVQILKLVCHPCQMSYNHAKGHTPSKENMWSKNIEISMTCNKTQSFSGWPTSSKKVNILEKSYLGVSNTSQGSVPLEFDNPPLNLIEITWKQVDITALGPDLYIWLKNRAMIHISIHTPLVLESYTVSRKQDGEVHTWKQMKIWWQTTPP